MKTLLKTSIAIVLVLNTIFLFSQEQITMNLSQDARLLFVGDDKGNDVGTLDLTFRSEWRGKQQQYGYMFVAPEIEYADLKGGIYRRYSANIGYTFNEGIFKNVNATASIGYGIIQYNGGYKGFGSNFQLSYQIIEGVALFLDAEIVDRKDLQFYETEELTFGERLRFSGKFGVKITVFKGW